MIHIDRSPAAFDPPRMLRKRMSRLFETPFDRRSRDLAARVADLRAKSDAELAELGLERRDILHHVFGSRGK